MKSTRRHIYVLGCGLSHDGSACLLKDGRIRWAIEKERITRIKHDGFNDTAAVQYCLDAEGITIEDVDLIVQNANFGMFERGNSWFSGPRVVPDGDNVVTISHHVAHAYSAFGPSPFDDAAVLIIDGCGNAFDECTDLDGAILPEVPPPDLRHIYFEKDSYYEFAGNSGRTLHKDFSQWGMGFKAYPLQPKTTLHSIGGLYLGASVYAFGGFEDPGKLMGLAPYGRPGVYDFPIFDCRDERVFLRYDWMKDFVTPARGYEDFQKSFQYYADLAYWIQREVERAILYTVASRRRLLPCSRLCYAGGVALNAVANRRILLESGYRDVFIQPAAGDNGLAIGCAYYGWLKVMTRPKVDHDGSSCFGRTYAHPELETALRKHEKRVSVSVSNAVAEDTAALLAEGQTIGWFQDRSEFGPRALGNRSILADPRKPGIRNYINSKIKFREDFRPFAPSVALEELSRFFDCPYESPYMLLVAPVRPEWKDVIAGVVHEDGSARIQTVSARSNPVYYQLIKSFQDATGIGVILNTSFNKKGVPIVETPDQAIEFFMGCGLDVLVLGDCIVTKNAEQVHAEVERELAQLMSVTVNEKLTSLPETARRIGGVFQLDVSTARSWTIDLSADRPRAVEGRAVMTPDVTVEVNERDLSAIWGGSEVITEYVNSGRLRVKGHQGKAMALLSLLRSK